MIFKYNNTTDVTVSVNSKNVIKVFITYMFLFSCYTGQTNVKFQHSGLIRKYLISRLKWGYLQEKQLVFINLSLSLVRFLAEFHFVNWMKLVIGDKFSRRKCIYFLFLRLIKLSSLPMTRFSRTFWGIVWTTKKKIIALHALMSRF